MARTAKLRNTELLTAEQVSILQSGDEHAIRELIDLPLESDTADTLYRSIADAIMFPADAQPEHRLIARTWLEMTRTGEGEPIMRAEALWLGKPPYLWPHRAGGEIPGFGAWHFGEGGSLWAPNDAPNYWTTDQRRLPLRGNLPPRGCRFPLMLLSMGSWPNIDLEQYGADAVRAAFAQVPPELRYCRIRPSNFKNYQVFDRCRGRFLIAAETKHDAGITPELEKALPWTGLEAVNAQRWNHPAKARQYRDGLDELPPYYLYRAHEAPNPEEADEENARYLGDSADEWAGHSEQSRAAWEEACGPFYVYEYLTVREPLHLLYWAFWLAQYDWREQHREYVTTLPRVSE